MIREIHVRGLKRFSDERVRMAPLSVLTGLNGSGKTSLLQAVFLAREASVTVEASLPLNGPCGMELGTAGEVLNADSEGPIEIDILDEAGVMFRWVFAVPTEDALYLAIAERPQVPFEMFRRAPRGFTVLSAERLGPREVYKTSSQPDDHLEVGLHGEFCAHVLSVLGDRPLAQADRTHPQSTVRKARLLKYEAEQWLSEMTRPIEINGVRPSDMTVSELQYRTPDTRWVRSTNMGFGLTYALPIILGGLIAESGGLLIVENPEAHLHPAGQSRMGVFLAWLANKGVQVVVETHSDHVLNGIRRAIAEFGYLPADQAVLHFFGQPEDGDDGQSHRTLSLSAAGALSAWPRGFFDQYQIDVASLGQIRRRIQE